MKHVSKFFLFVIANAIGFVSASVCYVIGVKSGVITVANPNFDGPHLQTFLGSIMMTWAVCAVFSLGYFFFRDRLRFLFLLAPALMPLAYGLSVLVLLR